MTSVPANVIRDYSLTGAKIVKDNIDCSIKLKNWEKVQKLILEWIIVNAKLLALLVTWKDLNVQKL